MPLHYIVVIPHILVAASATLCTHRYYVTLVSYFGNYLEEQGYSANLEDLDLEVVRGFVLYLQTRRKWTMHPYIPCRDGQLAAISVHN